MRTYLLLRFSDLYLVANTEKSRIGVDVKYLGTIDLDSLPEK